MSLHGLAASRKQDIRAVRRIGLFGILGAGNIGNDASLESVLRYLRTDHPDAVVDAMCSGPGRTTAQYGIEAIPLAFYQKYDRRLPRVPGLALKALGMGVDAYRVAWWVRRHDAVIVPGMGVLETSAPLRPWGFPYSMFLLCASGKLLGTKVALVSVGADIINKRATRWLLNSAARLASYRSYRDFPSREAMRQQGLEVSFDRVYPDLVYSIPVPHCETGDARVVAVGVMSYKGNNDDRRQAREIYASYQENIKGFIRWLVDTDYRVRLLVGDALDDVVVREIITDLRAHRPDLKPDAVIAEPVTSFAELVRAMAPAGTVVATRYHNVVCALKLMKPTISLGYAQKNKELMADAGMSEFCQSARSLDHDLLKKQFMELQSRSSELREPMIQHNAANSRRLEEQFSVLSTLLFPAHEHAIAGGTRR